VTILGREHPLDVFRRIDWWIVLVATALALVGLVFIHSATQYEPRFAGQHLRQTLFLAVSAGMAAILVLVPYPRIMRSAWVLYGAALLALLLLPVFGSTINGARRWYLLPGFAIQPSEFAKPALIVALAAWLRFRSQGRLGGNLLVPALITAVPAFLVMRQPDLGSSLVFWPILLAMSYAAGASLKQIGAFLAVGAVVILLAWPFLHDYQKSRVEVWAQHFGWEAAAENDVEVRKLIRGPAYQPWQSMIAMGSGGWTGFGLGEGPQNRYDFLPYRNADYVFSVIAEEQGLLGVTVLLSLQGALVMLLLRLAFLSRERFGRLLIIGVAAFLGTQSLMHIAVCAWLVPATGLPMPLISYGGSATMASVLALGLALGVGARRQPVVAADAFA
jgi:rod shape determining protein RodA